jgi:hypothetical protein
MHDHGSRLASILVALLLTVIAGCSAAGSSPSSAPTTRPSPTPIVVPVSSAADAAALVIATDPRFAGAIQLTPDLIGGSKYWKAEQLVGGGYRIELTLGWGDCPSGCIERHVWTFDVDANGGVKLVGETGDPVPSDLPA